MKNVFLIINYNDSETTIKLLHNISNYKILDKILVVDNNSTDNSFKILKEKENNNIEIVKCPVNKGYGAGINFGCRYIKEKYKDCYVIVSNPDVEIYNEESLKKLIDSFDNETSIVAPIIKEHEGLNRGWKVPSPIQDVLLNLPSIHRYIRPKLLFYKDEYYNNEIIDVEAVSGCFFIIKLSDLEQANYFDENMFLYYEENTISVKLKKINKKIKLNTKTEVFHNHSVTIDKNINKIRKYKELKKSQMYFQKYYNKANVFEICLLWLTNKLTLILLYIRGIFKK